METNHWWDVFFFKFSDLGELTALCHVNDNYVKEIMGSKMYLLSLSLNNEYYLSGFFFFVHWYYRDHSVLTALSPHQRVLMNPRWVTKIYTYPWLRDYAIEYQTYWLYTKDRRKKNRLQFNRVPRDWSHRLWHNGRLKSTRTMGTIDHNNTYVCIMCVSRWRWRHRQLV